MKGINVKKIAALAGTGILLGASLGFADVVYGDTQVVDQNGQPTVKVYVGSAAAISDGVAAANIAAKIANEAYMSSTLTASVSGDPTCTVGSDVGGTGTCELVESSKTVTLEVTLPGSIAGTHQFKTLITDTVDRTLQNRNATRSEDNYTSTMGSSDTSGALTSPLRAVEGDTARAKNLYKIGSGQFTGFADYSMVDTQAVSTTYTEEQNFWVGSTVGGVKYDSSSAYRDIIVNKFRAMAYNLKFTGNDYGIPVCTGDLNSTLSDDWTSCATDSNSRTDRHRLKLKFLGSEWIISEMNDPVLTMRSQVNATSGGTVKLAKEAKYGIVQVGGVLDAGTFQIRLSDISVAVGAANVHPAIIDVLDANEAVVGQIQVDPGSTYTFTQSGTGNTVKIHVYKTAPGFTLNAKWAEMAIYSDEVTLKDGQRYNLVSSTDTDKNFKVSLIWKNRDFTGSTGGNDSSADSLREIVVYNIDGLDSKVAAGDVVNFLEAAPTFKLTYNGLDLTDDDYQPLTYDALSPDTYRVATTTGDVACGATSAADWSYADAKWVEIKTGGVQLLGGSGTNLINGGYLLEKVYFDPIGRYNNSSSTFNGTFNQSVRKEMWNPTIFWKVSGRDCYNWNSFSYEGAAYTTTDSNAVRFETAGDNTAALGGIFFTNNSTLTTTASDTASFQGAIVLKEDAGYYGLTSNNAVYTAIPYIANGSSSTSGTNPFRFRTADSSTQQAYYNSLAGGIWFTGYEPTFVSERGSKVTSVGTTDADFKVAKRVGLAEFNFAFADTSAATGGEEYVLGVGDSKVFGGVTVLVKAIDADCGSCSVLGPGGTPACTVDTTDLTAVINPNNAASVEVTEPYKLTSNMVMLDTDGPSAGVAITVGGPAVNTMTADALQDSSVDFNVDTVVVKEVGNKIVVAGLTAEDTLTAADQFIAGVKRQ